MKLKFVDLMFRAWYYFRLGYGTYLNFFVGFFTFVSTTYYLAIRSLPFLQQIFPHFYQFVVVGILVIAPLGVAIGWFHMKRTLAYPTDVAIGVEANPYNYIIMPGKQKEAFAPAWLLILQVLQKILEKENMLSPEEKSQFENLVDKFEKMLKGEVIGVPRQRQVLAKLKREMSQMQ